MPEIKDYYKVLDVPEDADADAIKKAYRKLARQYHPDRNPDDPGAAERFKEIQEANEILADPEKRKQYDAMRKNPFGAFGGFRTGGGGQYYEAPDGTFIRFEGGGGANPFEGAGDGVGGFGDFFSRIFGGGEDPFQQARRRPPRRGRDVETQLRLSFEQALEGGKTEVTLPNGERVRLTIPKGVAPGFKIRLKGRGEQVPGGEAGHLYVTFDVEPHPDFRREGDDLFATVRVNALEAMLGTQRNLTNAYGQRVKVPIPAGTQPGARLRLKNQGIETRDDTGDLYVEIEVAIPEALTDEQKKVLREAGKEAGLL